MGLREQFPHTLVPLELAVLIVQQDVYGKHEPACEAQLDAIATYIASAVPLYAVNTNAKTTATTGLRVLVNVQREGVLKKGGRELVFLDGRPTKHLLAVLATDIPCVVSMLREPERADSIRRAAVGKVSRELVKQSRDLRAHHRELTERRDGLMLRSDRVMRACKARHEGG